MFENIYLSNSSPGVDAIDAIAVSACLLGLAWCCFAYVRREFRRKKQIEQSAIKLRQKLLLMSPEERITVAQRSLLILANMDEDQAQAYTHVIVDVLAGDLREELDSSSEESK